MKWSLRRLGCDLWPLRGQHQSYNRDTLRGQRQKDWSLKFHFIIIIYVRERSLFANTSLKSVRVRSSTLTWRVLICQFLRQSNIPFKPWGWFRWTSKHEHSVQQDITDVYGKMFFFFPPSDALETKIRADYFWSRHVWIWSLWWVFTQLQRKRN